MKINPSKIWKKTKKTIIKGITIGAIITNTLLSQNPVNFQGKITNQQGTPIDSAEISIEYKGANGWSSKDSTITTDEQGNYDLQMEIPIVGIEENKKIKTLENLISQNYPNPVTTETTILINEKTDEIRITNTAGQTEEVIKGPDKNQWRIYEIEKHFPAGNHFATARDDKTGQLQTEIMTIIRGGRIKIRFIATNEITTNQEFQKTTTNQISDSIKYTIKLPNEITLKDTTIAYNGTNPFTQNFQLPTTINIELNEINYQGPITTTVTPGIIWISNLKIEEYLQPKELITIQTDTPLIKVDAQTLLKKWMKEKGIYLRAATINNNDTSFVQTIKLPKKTLEQIIQQQDTIRFTTTNYKNLQQTFNIDPTITKTDFYNYMTQTTYLNSGHNITPEDYNKIIQWTHQIADQYGNPINLPKKIIFAEADPLHPEYTVPTEKLQEIGQIVANEFTKIFGYNPVQIIIAPKETQTEYYTIKIDINGHPYLDPNEKNVIITLPKISDTGNGEIDIRYEFIKMTERVKEINKAVVYYTPFIATNPADSTTFKKTILQEIFSGIYAPTGVTIDKLAGQTIFHNRTPSEELTQIDIANEKIIRQAIRNESLTTLTLPYIINTNIPTTDYNTTKQKIIILTPQQYLKQKPLPETIINLEKRKTYKRIDYNQNKKEEIPIYEETKL